MNMTFERACKPDMPVWPVCRQLEDSPQAEPVYQVEIVFRESAMSRRFRSLRDIDQPCHYLVEIKRCGKEKLKTIMATEADAVHGDQIRRR